MNSALESRFEKCRAELSRRNQGHLLRWWPQFNPIQREQLLNDLESIPWSLVDQLIPTHVLRRPTLDEFGALAPASVFPKEPRPDKIATYEEARKQGEQLLRAGRVAAFTVAGGQGTRLGLDGPKGALPVTPVRGKSLFQLFAETMLAAGRRYGKPIPWYIMTSPANHAQTTAFFEQHQFFGLVPGDVSFFSQGMLPVFDFAGRLLLEEKHRLALAPDGHGGSLKAMAGSGALADMRRRGITALSYFQVDNPLVKPFDPLFIGLHAVTGSEMSTKVTPKADDLERVGNVCLVDGRVSVIEYSDVPESLAHARNPDGSRRFDAANIAVHLFDVEFIDRIVGQSFQLPFRRAEKGVPFVDERGAVRKPRGPNAVKLECFVFDALPLAKNPLVLEVDRAEEFSPVKNATGIDSLETSRRDQIARAGRWLERAGIVVPRRANGEPEVVVEIAPTFALDQKGVALRRDEIPPIDPATELYLG